MNFLEIDGERIEISAETAQNIRDGLNKEKPFERKIQNIRVSVWEENAKVSYPIRISLLRGDNGTKMGEFETITKRLPGTLLAIGEARLLAQTLLDCVKAVENK